MQFPANHSSIHPVATGELDLTMGEKLERKLHDYVSETKDKLNDEKQEEEEDDDEDDNDDDNEDIDEHENVAAIIDEEISTYCDKNIEIHQKDPLEHKMRKKRALLKLKTMVEDAISGNYLLEKPKKSIFKKSKKKSSTKELQQQLEDSTTLWGVPLLSSKGHEGTEIVLLKFLKANDYKVHSAYYMLRKVLKWRKEYKVDAILDEDILNHNNDNVLANVIRTGTSVDRQGHPLYYTMYGAFKDKKICARVFGTEESREKFMRLKIQYLEKSIKQLSFKSGEANSVVQITDLKNFPAPMKELNSVTKKIVTLFQSNYPGIINKNILINVPFWYYTSRVVTLKLKNPRAKKKFILARPSNVTQTLLKYISIEQLPIQYGGLKRENDVEFSPEDKVLEHTIKVNATGHVKIPINEIGVTVIWDYTVVGWDVTCKEEFIPDDEGSYNIMIKGAKKMKRPRENGRNSCYISEPGNIVITIENSTYARKKVFYRFKIKAISQPKFIMDMQ
ncbi:PATL4 [Linum grandiflorum]